MSDIRVALEQILLKRDAYNKAESYYEGVNGEVFANQRWFKLFRYEGSDFRFNFSKTVVDSVLNRLEIKQILAGTAEAEAYIDTIWDQTDIKLDINEIHRNALIYGDSYAIVWPDENGDLAIDYNSPINTVMIYDQDNPRIKSFAAKLWQVKQDDSTKILKLNMYYKDRIEKYATYGDLDTMSQGMNLKLIDVIPNPWNEIPVFHFRTHKPYGRPEHADAFGPQDAINKLISTHMLTVDYQGAPQRYALAAGGNGSEFADFADDDTARENLSALQNGPGELWYLQGVSSVGQFPAADSTAFTNPVIEYVNAMASVTNTPTHYFMRGANLPSGQALRVAEAPLFKKVLNRQLAFGSTWRDLFKFMFKIDGVPADVEIKWENAESVDSLDNWDIAVRKKSVGVSLRQILIEAGYDPEIADAVVAESLGQPGEPLTPTSEVINAHNYALEQAAIERETVLANEQGNVPDAKA
jgi:hypothetical protein